MGVADKDVQISLSALKLEIIFKGNPTDIRTQILAALPHTHTHTHMAESNERTYFHHLFNKTWLLKLFTIQKRTYLFFTTSRNKQTKAKHQFRYVVLITEVLKLRTTKKEKYFSLQPTGV